MPKKPNKLLIVDDIEINRIILEEIFSKEFEILMASNGQEALDLIYIHQSELAIVLLDVVMPVMDGFEVLKKLNEEKIIGKVPVILITGEDEKKVALEGYSLGVSDLIYKPFNTDVTYKRINNTVEYFLYKNNLEALVDEQKLLIEEREKKIKQFNLFIIDTLSTTVEFRNLESGTHIKRIRTFTRFIAEVCAKYYPFTQEELDSISSASALHDIGKISIPDDILLKPGPLTKDEFEIMKTHSSKGSEILKSIDYFEDKQYWQYCYDICRHHHERWDGRGYPDGLAGDNIPVWAQVTSIADVYDALTTKRIYKGAFSHAEALNMINAGQCGNFNPKILECLNKNDERLKLLANELGNEGSFMDDKK